MTTALEHGTVAQRIRGLLQRGAQEAARREAPLLVSTTARIPHIDPLVAFARARQGERVYWEQPGQELSLAAIGAAQRLTGRADERFAQITASRHDLLSSALVEEDDGAPLPGPVCLGGFSFDAARQSSTRWCGYGDALLIVPTYLIVSNGGSSWLTITASVGAADDPAALANALDGGLRELLTQSPVRYDAESEPAKIVAEDEGRADLWKGAVGDVIEQIRQGVIQKLVLAREVRLRASAPLEPGAALRRLRSGYGDCTLFAFAQGEHCFLGATPERLVRLDGAHVRAACVAGSAARGATAEDDRSLGEALLLNAKERHEHAVVVDALREALEPVCAQLTVPQTPALFQTRNIQHLYTPVEGRLGNGATVLELLERLHPTPAVGGLPRDAALALLRTHEPFDRGWYAGPVGWIDRKGSGEFVVAIRSALLAANEASLYAGCGIMAESDPEREYAESTLKLKPMLWALNGRTT